MNQFKKKMSSVGKFSGILSYTLSTGRTFTGNVTYMAPGNIKIRFSNPSGKILVANQKKLWLYDPQNKVCAIQELDQEEGMSGGILSLLRDYEVLQTLESEEGYSLKFSNENHEFTEITLVLDSSFFIKKGNFKNKEGSGFSFSVSGINFSPDIVKSVFDFNVPANTQIVKNPLNIK
ncbi:MAG TPA: outer membrane lipoprotein carrier protein LolA [Spirochaetota bacterium]|nr:outer membrane lipoprotein carrier protein LolA [Spirochaetota bacterium]HPI90694.1 outer membrane lipoprotein carrier protein LolA [Spirochaetota bacterium]HPR49297.1 outer membrane lipoprotein carrier protein LolA [Spirochaetota bacterium]